MSLVVEPQPLPVAYARPSAVLWATPERRLVLCALATSALLYLCYFPVAWGFLACFAWYLLGYSQHRFDTLIQLADVTGVYGLSFLLVAVNALVFEWLYRLAAVRWLIGQGEEPAPTRRPVLAFQSAVALLVFA